MTSTDKTLNDILGPDTLPIMVNENGEIFENVITEHAPEYGSYGEDYEDMITQGINGWKAISGRSNQEGYNGVVFHPSEYIGNELAKIIRETPGFYAVETIQDEDDETYGWILLHKPI